jgi:hypothetical protein
MVGEGLRGSISAPHRAKVSRLLPIDSAMAAKPKLHTLHPLERVGALLLLS